MFIGYAAVAALLAFALSASAFLTFTRNPQITGNMTKLGVPESWLPWLATAKAAGAIGLLAGLAVAPLGMAAATGVTLYMAGGILTHLRAKDYEIAPVAVLTLLATAALILRIASA
ncbi:putative integral membrane protein [Streptomyces venezuelae]|uniref:DoxX family protein n=1 Tax=Streptomyces gardneri TaxID=66892 RepID=UPI0006BD6CAB|nr:DoxX family protein [Streptomyces gardneri]ALO09516.1 putative integral membrane protein [Streptomyces venezuelae]QPK46615.1 DoxX family protein [Streptomyces gardneri]WRK38010.1 DoxX family protein [Streptomyces venezuelae]CUM40061.1 putative integral membrane protein [Streptomyces venezuelae]